MISVMLRSLSVFAFLLIAVPASALEPGDALPDPALEARAKALAAEVRCMVCQNQSVAESESSLAGDMRRIIRQRVAAGEDDDAVLAFLVQRYGDFVLLRPPMRRSTWLLWFGPLLVFAAGAIGLAVYYRRRRPTAVDAALDPEERVRLDALLRSENGRR